MSEEDLLRRLEWLKRAHLSVECFSSFLSFLRLPLEFVEAVQFNLEHGTATPSS